MEDFARFSGNSIRKSLMSINSFARNSRARMAAPILWALGIFWFFSAGENLHAHKIPRFRGGGILGFGWGEVPILFLWVQGFF